MDFITVAGSIASIVGALYTLNEAVKAKSSAQQAKEIRNNIANEQKKIFISKLLTETNKAMSISIKMTTSATPNKKIRGLNYQSSIEQLRLYVDILKENSHYLKNENKKKLEEYYQSIERQFPKLANEMDQQKKYEIGDKIHNLMGEILKVIKPELDVY